jgi:hypothetical protein
MGGGSEALDAKDLADSRLLNHAPDNLAFQSDVRDGRVIISEFTRL